MATKKKFDRKKPGRSEDPLTTMTLFFRGVPRVLKQHFQAWCSLRGLSMKEVIVSMIREKIKQTGLKQEIPEDD